MEIKMNKAVRSLDARHLLGLAIPRARQSMSDAQLHQVQKVLDIAVRNHELSIQRNGMMRQATIFQSPQGLIQDSRLATRAESLQVPVEIREVETHLRLDINKLLDPGALHPRTDNPDEKKYLEKVQQALIQQGVWLRFDHRWIKTPGDNSGVGENSFRAWLSFGCYGPEIHAPMGQLTREALLGLVTIGKGYYSEVYEGPIQTKINELIKYVDMRAKAGRELHSSLEVVRIQSAPGVPQVSDLRGGTKFPDKKIWDLPINLLLEAVSKNSEGNTIEAAEILFDAEIAVQIVALQLEKYCQATNVGAEKVVGTLDLLRKAGKVAECVLLVHAIAGGVARFIVSRSAAKNLGTQFAKNRSEEAFARTADYSTDAFARTANYSNEAFAKTANYAPEALVKTAPSVVEKEIGRLSTLNLGTTSGIGSATMDIDIAHANYIGRILRAAQEEVGFEQWWTSRELRKRVFADAFKRAREIFGN